MKLRRRAVGIGRALAGAALLTCTVLSRAQAQTAEDRPLDPVDAPGRAEPVPAGPSTEAADPSSFASSIPRRPAESLRLSELAATAPGVLIRDLGVNQPATISLRGSTPDQVLVLFDGVPLNPAAGGGTDLSLVPVQLVDRLSVIRGAVGARYGGGATGGVLSLSSRAPAQPGERDWYGEVSYGSFSTIAAATGISIAAGQHLSALVTGFLSSVEGDFGYKVADRPLTAPDVLREYTRENNQARRAGAMARLTYDGPVEASVLVEADGGERGIPGTHQNPTPHQRQDDVRGLGSGRLAFLAGGVRVEARLMGRLSRLHLGTWDDHGPAQDEALVFGAVSASKLLGRHAVELGVTGGRESLSSAYHGDHGRGTFGAYACDELSFSLLTIVPAFRYERVGDLNGYSPKLGAIVPLGESVSLKANAGRSFRAPSFGELYLETGFQTPNPNLSPETGTYADLGPELHWGPWVASAAAYWGLYEDLILFERYAPQRSKPYNFGRAEVWGGELEAGFQTGVLSASAAYTLAFSANRLDDPRYLNKELPYRPRHRLHARVGAQWWRLEGHVEADLQSEQFLNRTNQDSLPGHARFDLGASIALDRDVGLSLHVQVKNVFDQWDQDLYGYPLPGRAFYLALRFDSPNRSNP